MDEKAKIQNLTLSIISRVGLRNLSIERLANTLGISKKTIYKHFKTKEELVIDILESNFQKSNTEIDLILAEDNNPILQLLDIFRHFYQQLAFLNPDFTMEIYKNYPMASQHIQEKKKIWMENVFMKLLSEAKENNIIHPHTDPAKIFKALELIFGAIQKAGPKYLTYDSLEETFTYTIKVYVKGLLTPENQHLIEI
jgi:AcrR family transcriptional regulator